MTTKEMTFVVVGLGSIGIRHADFLIFHDVPASNISVVRRKESRNPIGKVFLEDKGVGVKVFDSLEDALERRPTAALICNPTSMHTETARQCAEAGCHLFIEKPLTSDGGEIKKLQFLSEYCKEKGLVSMVGFNMMFHDSWQRVLENYSLIGRPISFVASATERVDRWHSWEDHRHSYACRSDLGGGVIATQCHEIQMLYALFGLPSSVFATALTDPSLQMGVENVANIIYSYGKPQCNQTANLHLSYLETTHVRFVRLTGEDGTLHWDMKSDIIFLEPNGGQKRSIPGDVINGRNRSFMEEIKAFLMAISGEGSALTNHKCQLTDGIAVSKMIIATKKSTEKGESVEIK